MTKSSLISRGLQGLLALLLVLPLAGWSNSNERPRPLLEIDRAQIGGEEAIRILGDKIGDVATLNRMTKERLADILRRDRNIFINKYGLLVAYDPAPKLNSRTNKIGTKRKNSASLIDSFALHSRKGSAKTLYLNFVGSEVRGTIWNESAVSAADLCRAGAEVWVAPPFDLDGNPAEFSIDERAVIHGIWERVSEDFSIFDIDVTTEPPSPDAINRKDAKDKTFGTGVLVTTNTGLANCENFGGIANVGIFDRVKDGDYYKPALVFYNNLSNGYEKHVADAISHEAGHTLGLAHDSSASSSTGYYDGHGVGAGSWGPIMGSPYNQSVVQWSKGEYSGASETQDDISMISASGARLLPDDYGGDLSSAYPIPASGVVSVSGSVGGVLERASDVDMFYIDLGVGDVVIDVRGYSAAHVGNADVKIKLLNKLGGELSNSAPVDQTGAQLKAIIATEGRYYIGISPDGNRDPFVDGYSTYGSVGRYYLSVSGKAPGKPVIGDLTAVSPIGVGGAISGTFRITDPNGDLLTKVRVSASYSYDGSSCLMNVGKYSGTQPGGLKTFSGCSSLTTTPGTVYLKVEGWDVNGLQADVVRTTVQVNGANAKPAVTGLNAATPITTGGALSGSFTITDPNGDQVTKLRVHASYSYDGSSCTMDIGTYSGTQPGGLKTFSGCSSLTTTPGTVHLKVEGWDVNGLQADVVRTTVQVNSANAKPTITGLTAATPITAGGVLSGNFTITDPNGDQVTKLRVHASYAYDGSSCTMDIGTYSGSQPGGPKTFSGCSSLTTTPGTVYLKVEGWDVNGLQADIVRTTVQVNSANAKPTITGLTAATPITAGGALSGSFTITDPNGDQVTKLRVHASYSYDGSSCTMDIGTYSGTQPGGLKTFSGCSSLTTTPGTVHLKVEGWDVNGLQADIVRTTVQVNSTLGTVSGRTPDTLTKNVSTRVTVTGNGFPATAVFAIDNVVCNSDYQRTGSTSISQTCTAQPGTPSTTYLRVKDGPGGNYLSNGNGNFAFSVR